MNQKRNINTTNTFSRNYSFLEKSQSFSRTNHVSSSRLSNNRTSRDSSRPSYVFGSAAPKIEERPSSYRGPDVEVVVGGKTSSRQATQAQPQIASVVFGIVGVLLVCFLAVGIINVSLSSATQASALEAQTTQEAIDQARESGKSLEVSLGSLSNPTRIKEKASEIGLSASSESIKIDLSGDKVVLDESGNISLSGSLSASAES